MDRDKFNPKLDFRKLSRRCGIIVFVTIMFTILLFATLFASTLNENAFTSNSLSTSVLTPQNTIVFNDVAIALETAVHIGDETTLRSTINDATEPTIIALTADIKLTGSALNIPVTKNITIISDKENDFCKLVGDKECATIVINRGTLTLAGVIVTHNKGDSGSGVVVNSGGTLIMIDGEIFGNSADNGGGVYNSGTFEMRDNAIISGNTATKNGGGVYNIGVFNMLNGTIGGSTISATNTADDNGGGVYNANGHTFTMSGGQIFGNTAKNGDNVFNEGNTTSSGGLTSVVVIFGVVAGIFVVGCAGEFLIKKAGIPIFIFLILAGIVLGPGLNIFPRESLLSVLPLFATLTLLMVLFHAGLGLKTHAVLSIGGRVFLQTIVYTFVGTALLGSLGYFVLKWDFTQSFIFAAIIGGEITAAVIVPLSNSMKLKEKTIVFLTMEAAISSVFSVVLFSTLINIYLTGKSSIVDALANISIQFSVGIFAGFLLSIAWVYILHRFQKHKFIDVLTIGFILLTYSVTTIIGGNGTLAALVFGIIFGNYHLVNRILKTKINIDKLQQQIVVFYDEITFLLETLFFVSLGLIFVIEPSLILAGIMFTVVLIMTRFGAVKISTFKSDLAKEKQVITFMCALGLTPATLAILTISYGLPLAYTIVNVVTYTIIFSNIVTAVWSTYYMRKRKCIKKEQTEQKYTLLEVKETEEQ
ncbi:MAG: cation:proton antiporter [Candidatus Bathyarchaeota archaeon]|nr:cation:proton antiporter [Candidatus Termiticorpusculum sp.]